MEILIKKLEKSATIPSRAYPGDAGADLYASVAATIHPGERSQVKTGIAVAVPEDYVLLIWDKSGLSHKDGIKVLGGVVDSGFRGEVLVGMINLGEKPVVFNIGDKVAQFLIQRVEKFEPLEVVDLPPSVRGDAGFGSSGIK